MVFKSEPDEMFEMAKDVVVAFVPVASVNTKFCSVDWLAIPVVVA